MQLQCVTFADKERALLIMLADNTNFYFLWVFTHESSLSHRNSVRVSVCHTGWSVKNSAS